MEMVKRHVIVISSMEACNTFTFICHNDSLIITKLVVIPAKLLANQMRGVGMESDPDAMTSRRLFPSGANHVNLSMLSGRGDIPPDVAACLVNLLQNTPGASVGSVPLGSHLGGAAATAQLRSPPGGGSVPPFTPNHLDMLSSISPGLLPALQVFPSPTSFPLFFYICIHLRLFWLLSAFLCCVESPDSGLLPRKHILVLFICLRFRSIMNTAVRILAFQSYTRHLNHIFYSQLWMGKNMIEQ